MIFQMLPMDFHLKAFIHEEVIGFGTSYKPVSIDPLRND